jgi:uncharacterized protein YkwD
MGCKNCKYQKIEENKNEIKFNNYNNIINLNNSNDVLKTRKNSNNIIYKNNNFNEEKLEINLDIYHIEVLKCINIHRFNHNVPPLEYNKDIEKISQLYAENLSKKNTLVLSYNKFNNEELGESLFSCSELISPFKLVDNWYNNGNNINFDEIEQPSHFSQMIWKNSKYFALGVGLGNNNYIFIVANYYPGGNIQGKFKENVLPLNKNNLDKNNNNNNNLDSNYLNINNKNNILSISPKTNNKFSLNDYKNVIFTSNEFALEALEEHNYLRSLHNTAPLILNQNLNLIAQKNINYLAENNLFTHFNSEYNGQILGENLYMCQGFKINGKIMTDNWYKEGKNYDYNGDYKINTGQFTQLLWKNTNECGFAFKEGKNGIYYGIGLYYPPGNFLGEFKDNVKPK